MLDRVASAVKSIFSTELVIDERFRPLATATVLLFAIGYSVGFLGLMQHVAYLGPGLGDEFSFKPYLQLLSHIEDIVPSQQWHPALLCFLILSFVNVLFTATIIFMGYALYPSQLGKPFPITVLYTYLSLNVICAVGIVLLQLVAGVIAYLIGFSVMDGFYAFDDLLNNVRTLAHQVPTLIELPGWAAFFVLQMAGGFFHYWFHRLAHESRTLWLLFHRTHHMTPELIQPSAQAVFNAFPFFLFAAVPYVLIFSVIGTLISSESLLIYLIIYKLLSAFANIFSHQSALYQWAQGKWYIRFLSTVTSEGVYHYLHHSAESSHNQPRGNLINIGGGMFFFWDRVFGTYRPVTNVQPRVGLQGIEPEDMTSNPFRLAFAGIAQLVYEIRWSQGLMEKVGIVFFGSDYVPKKSKDFVKRESLG